MRRRFDSRSPSPPAAARSHVMDRFDADEALRLIEQQGITHSQWVPAMFQRLLALPAERRSAFSAPAHRAAIHGAAPCPPAVKKAMIDWWGPILVEYYSGSEGIGLTLIDSAEALQRPGSVGRARKGTLHIADESGAEVPAGVTGLVCFSGVAPFAYHKAPEKTAARTLPQGWQTFGDIGHVDADGYLYLTDRLDDMIISGGVNLYPQEIEAAIREVARRMGLRRRRRGRRALRRAAGCFRRAAARRRCGHAGADRRACNATASSISAASSTRSGFEPLDSLPRSPTGKLLRRRLRELATSPQEPSE